MILHDHQERHFQGSEIVRDIVIGMADGLTVPFALAAGISGAIGANGFVVAAGLAEIAAGSIAMGLGGYLAAKSQIEHYANEARREAEEIVEKPEAEKREVAEILTAYGLTADECGVVVEGLARRPEAWRDFMMRFELGLEKPNPKRALQSAAAIGGSYIVGGLIPLGPYMLTESPALALWTSVSLTLVALFVFGYGKAYFTGVARLKGALQMLGVGSLAAAVAYLLAKWVS